MSLRKLSRFCAGVAVLTVASAASVPSTAQVPNGPSRPLPVWHSFFAVDPLETPAVGDFDGDGRTDIITFTRQNPLAVGDVYVALSNGSQFVGRSGVPGSSDKWHDWFAVSSAETVVIGDYDGDGRDDIATWLSATTRQVYVALSKGDGMGQETVWLQTIGADPGDVLLSGDADGDGREDLVLFARTQGRVYVALSTGSGFRAPDLWHGFFAVSTFERPRVADVNGDGKADIVTLATDSPTAQGDVYVAVSDGTRFVGPGGVANSSSKWHDWFAVRPDEQVRTGDIDGDGKDDFVTILPPPWGQCYTALSNGASLAASVLCPEVVAPDARDTVHVADVNGDGRADLIVFAQAEGKVYVLDAAWFSRVAIDFERFPGPDGRLGTTDDVPTPLCPVYAPTPPCSGPIQKLATQYAAVGIVFSSGTLQNFGDFWPGHVHGISSTPPIASFSVPVRGLRITSHSYWTATLTAYDASSTVIGTAVLAHPSPGSYPLSGTLRVDTTQPIAWFSVLPDQPDHILNLDDLEFAVDVTR